MANRSGPMGKESDSKLSGKHGAQMSSMFDKKGEKAENFHTQMANSLNQNKIKYDRQLYSDWITRVYDKCAAYCIKQDSVSHSINELREIEKICGRNCIRKYDKIYKLYDSLEGAILEDYINDSNIDQQAFMDQYQSEQQNSMTEDINAGAELMAQNRL